MTETQYEYPTTARRAFVNLSEAIRTFNEEKGLRNMLLSLAGMHVNESLRLQLVVAYMQFLEDDWGSETPIKVRRSVLAHRLAMLLDGQEKFDTARFIHHATSDSTADDDGESGKWSYNRLHQAEAQKTTIESVPDDGEGETVILG
jgi:hypothetical protein